MLMLMQYLCSPLKGGQNKPGTDFRFYVVEFAQSIPQQGGGVAESLKVTGIK